MAPFRIAILWRGDREARRDLAQPGRITLAIQCGADDPAGDHLDQRVAFIV